MTAFEGARWRAALLSLVMPLFAIVNAGQAAAQTGEFSTTTAYTETVFFNPAAVTVTTVTGHSTQIIGRLAGGAALYDQTFGAAFTDPVVQAGVAAARVAITAAGGPGVIIGAAVLTATSTTAVSSSTTTYSLAGSQDVINPGVITFGPANLVVGQLSTCNVSGLPSTTRPTCQNLPGTSFVLGLNDTDVNIRIDRTYTVDQATATTNTTTVFEQYTITGVVQALGRVHALAPGAIADQGERFTQRLLGVAGEEGAEPIVPLLPGASANAITSFTSSSGSGTLARPGYSAWLNGFGWHGRRAGSAGTPGDSRYAYGLEGGIAGNVTENLRLGFGLDHAQVQVNLHGSGESLRLDLTQVGMLAGWRAGAWYLAGAATAGFGHVATSVVAPGFGTAGGSYSASSLALSGEAGYRTVLGGWSVTPHLGAEWRRVSIGAFTETGGLALTSPGGTFDRGRFWAGINARRTFDLGAMAMSLSSYVRLAGYTRDTDVLPVAFVLAPGAKLSLTSPSTGRIGLETGITGSLALTANAHVFAGYDLRLRDRLVMHTGTAGLKVTW